MVLLPISARNTCKVRATCCLFSAFPSHCQQLNAMPKSNTCSTCFRPVVSLHKYSRHNASAPRSLQRAIRHSEFLVRPCRYSPHASFVHRNRFGNALPSICYPSSSSASFFFRSASLFCFSILRISLLISTASPWSAASESSSPHAS